MQTHKHNPHDPGAASPAPDENVHAPTNHNQAHAQHPHAYRNLLIMAVLSFISMYALMYAMVDKFSNVIPNLNQFYMAGLMTAPMIVLELILMASMYRKKSLNLALIAISIVLGLTFWFGIRKQVAIDDETFLKSMIPHHAGAILMCNEAELSNPKVQSLCVEIVAAQEQEISQMRSLLEELKASPTAP